jgi:hypothetical protein
LTVAALDGSVVDRDTVRQLVYGLSPSLLAPMYVVNFREPLRLEWLLSDGFAQEFRAAFSRRRWNGCRRASDFLAQLTDGDLLRLQLRRRARGALVVNRAGDAISVNSISSSERDQVYLSLCLALISAIARHGVELPLVLDEPFVRLDRRSSLALAAVLADFSQRGQQVLVFTARQEVAERFAALGATVHDMLVLQQRRVEPALAVVSEAKMQAAQETVRATGRTAGAARRKRRQAG